MIISFCLMNNGGWFLFLVAMQRLYVFFVAFDCILLYSIIKIKISMMTRKNKGFTIIEVVLVLAIAGLIFLMVFVALPALQQSQRNTQRKNDLTRFMSAVSKWQVNNRNSNGMFLTTDSRVTNAHIASLVTRYIDESCEVESTFDEGGVVEGVRVSMAFVKFNNCSSQFTDPDGTIYTIYYRGSTYPPTNGSYGWLYEAGLRVYGEDFDIVSAIKNDGGEDLVEAIGPHGIYAMAGAKCSDNEGYIQMAESTGRALKSVTFIMMLEGGAVACVDNT